MLLRYPCIAPYGLLWSLCRPRRGSLPATQPMPSSLASAGAPSLYRGSPYSRSLPESSQSSQAALAVSTASVTSPVTSPVSSFVQISSCLYLQVPVYRPQAQIMLSSASCATRR